MWNFLANVIRQVRRIKSMGPLPDRRNWFVLCGEASQMKRWKKEGQIGMEGMGRNPKMGN
jgi:hypothetical protein